MILSQLVYPAPPNREHKGARELREKGAMTILPDDTTGKRRRVTAPGYVFADRAVDTTFAKHVRPRMPGRANIDAVMRMFCRPTPKPEPADERRFEVDDKIRIKSGPFADKTATITSERGRKWFMALITGSSLEIAVQPRNMIHIDPG